MPVSPFISYETKMTTKHILVDKIALAGNHWMRRNQGGVERLLAVEWNRQKAMLVCIRRWKFKGEDSEEIQMLEGEEMILIYLNAGYGGEEGTRHLFWVWCLS